MSKPMRDFTKGELEWTPWITPVDLDNACVHAHVRQLRQHRFIIQSLDLRHSRRALAEQIYLAQNNSPCSL